MKVLYLKDWGVERVRRTLPCFANTKLLARGSFGAVFETADPNRVLKLTTDEKHYAYLTDGLAPQGCYKPVVLVDHGEVGETEDGLTLYLVEMERLQKVRTGTENGRLTRRIVNYVGAHAQSAFPETTTAVRGLPAALAGFLEDLNTFISNFACAADAHWGNFMERMDGTLVVSDPVYDKPLLDRKRREYFRKREAARYGHA
jgi:hypothetical protein